MLSRERKFVERERSCDEQKNSDSIFFHSSLGKENVELSDRKNNKLLMSTFSCRVAVELTGISGKESREKKL